MRIGPVPEIALVPFDPERDVDAVVAFLTRNPFPFHVESRVEEGRARAAVAAGRYWCDDRAGYWVVADGARVGAAILEDLEDARAGGSPLFDLRLADSERGRGLAVPVLSALTALVFTRFPEVRRFEGQTREDNVAMRKTFLRCGWVKEAHYRESWPVAGGEPKASVAYAVLRRDWETGTTTPVVWDDLVL